MTCDVTDEAQVRAAVALAAQDGRLDVAVSGAAPPVEQIPITDLEVDAFDRMLAVNVRGVFLSMKHELRLMRSQRWGSIVNISSVAGLVGAAGFAAYCATKSAIIGMTRSAALEVSDIGVRVNAVCPALTETPLLAGLPRDAEPLRSNILAHPVKRMARPAEIAASIVFLCSEHASFMTGAVVPVDGGYSAV